MTDVAWYFTAFVSHCLTTREKKRFFAYSKYDPQTDTLLFCAECPGKNKKAFRHVSEQEMNGYKHGANAYMSVIANDVISRLRKECKR